MNEPTRRPRLGISACVLGQNVRYDGGHKRDAFVVNELSGYFDFTPYCPEVAAGLGTPRPPIRLVGDDPDSPRAVGVRDDALDVTERLEDYALSAMTTVDDLCGFILKKDSPSCGMERVKLYPVGGGAGQRVASGIFARVLQQTHPALPVEEEGRLNDPLLRENFINRVYVVSRWQQLLERGLTPASMIDFHTRHKYLVMAHSTAAYQRLGRLLSDLSGGRLGNVAPYYFEQLMLALKRRVTRKRHYNTLQHILGYLKRRIDAGDKEELLDAMQRYKTEEVPLIVPVTLFRHYFRKNPDPYIQDQVYLAPHPDALRLRNHI